MAGLLSRRKTKALVSARLASLGHNEDFITQDALDALRARAGHETGSFAAALGAVLFLAATEDAPRIESRHVEQAVPHHKASVTAAPRGWPAWQIVAACAFGAAAGAVLVMWTMHRQGVVPPTVPAPTPKHQPPPIVVSLPERRLAAPAPPAALPVAPPLRVSLLAPAGDHETVTHAADLVARLRDAGIGDVQIESFNSRKIDARPWRPPCGLLFQAGSAACANFGLCTGLCRKFVSPSQPVGAYSCCRCSRIDIASARQHRFFLRHRRYFNGFT